MSGIVYAITHGGMTYFGSSEQNENDRWLGHKDKYKNNTSTGGSLIMFLRAALDEELPTFTVLEMYDDIDSEERRKIEQWYIDSFECVNKKRAFATEEQHREQMRAWNIKNKEKKTKYNKEYQEKNREKRIEQMKAWCGQNKEILKQKRKEKQAKKRLEINSIVL